MTPSALERIPANAYLKNAAEPRLGRDRPTPCLPVKRAYLSRGGEHHIQAEALRYTSTEAAATMTRPGLSHHRRQPTPERSPHATRRRHRRGAHETVPHAQYPPARETAHFSTDSGKSQSVTESGSSRRWCRVHRRPGRNRLEVFLESGGRLPRRVAGGLARVPVAAPTRR